MLKEELAQSLHSVFQKTEEEGELPSRFIKLAWVLIVKPETGQRSTAKAPWSPRTLKVTRKGPD